MISRLNEIEAQLNRRTWGDRFLDTIVYGGMTILLLIAASMLGAMLAVVVAWWFQL